MNSVNSVIIEGSLINDAKLVVTPKGTSICDFKIKTTYFFNEEEKAERCDGIESETSFFRVETKNRLADHVYKYGKKGCTVKVIGRLKEERHDAPFGFGITSFVSIVAVHLQFREEVYKEEEKKEGKKEDG